MWHHVDGLAFSENCSGRPIGDEDSTFLRNDGQWTLIVTQTHSVTFQNTWILEYVTSSSTEANFSVIIKREQETNFLNTGRSRYYIQVDGNKRNSFLLVFNSEFSHMLISIWIGFFRRFYLQKSCHGNLYCFTHNTQRDCREHRPSENCRTWVEGSFQPIQIPHITLPQRFKRNWKYK